MAEHDLTPLEVAEGLLNRTLARLRDMKAITARDSAVEHVLPCMQAALEAIEWAYDDTQEQLFGDEETEGEIGDLQARLSVLEERFAQAASALAVATRLRSLANRVKAECLADKPALATDAAETLDFLDRLEREAVEALEAEREAEEEETETPESATAPEGPRPPVTSGL